MKNQKLTDKEKEVILDIIIRGGFVIGAITIIAIVVAYIAPKQEDSLLDTVRFTTDCKSPKIISSHVFPSNSKGYVVDVCGKSIKYICETHNCKQH